MKFKITLTATRTIPVDKRDYPHNVSVQQMMQISKELAEADPFSEVAEADQITAKVECIEP